MILPNCFMVNNINCKQMCQYCNLLLSLFIDQPVGLEAKAAPGQPNVKVEHSGPITITTQPMIKVEHSGPLSSTEASSNLFNSGNISECFFYNLSYSMVFNKCCI